MPQMRLVAMQWRVAEIAMHRVRGRRHLIGGRWMREMGRRHCQIRMLNTRWCHGGRVCPRRRFFLCVGFRLCLRLCLCLCLRLRFRLCLRVCLRVGNRLRHRTPYLLRLRCRLRRGPGCSEPRLLL